MQTEGSSSPHSPLSPASNYLPSLPSALQPSYLLHPLYPVLHDLKERLQSIHTVSTAHSRTFTKHPHSIHRPFIENPQSMPENPLRDPQYIHIPSTEQKSIHKLSTEHPHILFLPQPSHHMAGEYASVFVKLDLLAPSVAHSCCLGGVSRAMCQEWCVKSDVEVSSGTRSIFSWPWKLEIDIILCLLLWPAF